MSQWKGFRIIALGLPAFCAARPDESALTIYSSQQPGAIAAEFYRPVPGGPVPAATSVPGYAMVRQDRDVQLSSGRSSLRFSDVAGLSKDSAPLIHFSVTVPKDGETVIHYRVHYSW